MTVKILVTGVGQHVIADVKQIENKDTNEVVGYWLKDARVVAYTRSDANEGNVNIGFVNFCLVADEQEFSLKAEHVVAILEPRQDVVDKYLEVAVPAPNELVENEPSTDTAEIERPSDLLD